MAYGFYHPVPEIVYVGKGKEKRRCHEFQCAANGCKYISRRFQDTKDRSSTGNMVKHAKLCWGQDVYKLAEQCRDVAEVRSKVTGPITSSGSISADFRPEGNGRVPYSRRMPTKTEIKFVTYLRGFF